MSEFKVLKKFIWLPFAVAPLLSGCSFFLDTKEYDFIQMVGFSSDTTAILFRYNWEKTEDCFAHLCGGDNYLDLELMLVDVRYHKVHWKSRVKNNYGENFRVRQWSDSLVFIDYDGKIGENRMLWTIGDSKPLKVNFSLEGYGLENFDEKTLDLQIPPNLGMFDLYQQRQWKNETILMWRDTTRTGNLPEYLLLNRKNFVISVWQPSAEEKELAEKGAIWDGEKFIYLENETSESCKAFVISGNGDTLHTIGHYPYIELQEFSTEGNVFDKRCEFGFLFAFAGNLISIRAINNISLPATLLPKDTSNIPNIYGLTAMVFIDKNKRELLNPSFWYDGRKEWQYGVGKFINLSGNITEY
ncbi:MAG: hypothetical protein LBQ76_09135 [Candidatus Fibromonas sp.]|jgi:hypothetical protein|nr:hypothetical protein [Candidatus Fibromonas sp.]